MTKVETHLVKIEAFLFFGPSKTRVSFLVFFTFLIYSSKKLD